MPPQILDDGIQEDKKVFLTAAANRWAWYFKHAGMVIGLYLLITCLLVFVLPYLPKIIDDLLLYPLMILSMFGMCGITIYTFYKGFNWNILGAFLLGSLLFIIGFVVMMTNGTALSEAYGSPFVDWLGLSEKDKREVLSIMVVGIGYSILLPPLSEGFILTGQFFLWLLDLVRGKKEDAE